ncbi:pyruvate dehydrogenase E1 component alpha subunit [Nakamurella flavida]|uniref:thiamine pyrophosphate-dependent dehydrogenase E1 component subunit alpha n=1 Tax=Nakamurella flavida TaxID=363630 RepID=UPI002789B25B|nr:thiamine pyrophosphate-dependent dehydrogenase E1 component subunit alpha [Nakamurella flavida]MDP9778938.1 pyruvate dehydrogenase E1 component alpha subunit [Nakamurella flavida]
MQESDQREQHPERRERSGAASGGPEQDPPTTARDAAAQGAAGTAAHPTPEQVVAGLRATSEGPDLVELLSPEGVFTPHPDYPLEVTAELLQGLYRDMVLVRRFDREGNALQRQGQLSLWAPLLGQEAAQIGAGRALRPTDMAFPSYREHGVAWCRGIDPAQLLGIFRGTDQCGWDPAATRFNGYAIVIGNQVLNAVGYAMGQRLDGAVGGAGNSASAAGAGADGPDGADGPEGVDGSEATIAFFGDGATSQGDVHEAMVFGAVFDAPVVFYCQNNQWAISEPVEKQSRVPLYRRAHGYGFPGVRVDGNDVLACLAVTRWALQECRSGNGPVMIEAFTYRMDAHTTSDDPTRYRLADEEEAWKLLDPIERVRVHLTREGLADAAFFERVAQDADELAAHFRAACYALDSPGPDRLFSHVYSGEHEQTRRQHAEQIGYLASFQEPAESGR